MVVTSLWQSLAANVDFFVNLKRHLFHAKFRKDNDCSLTVIMPAENLLIFGKTPKSSPE
jgi:hypothetical protein